MNANPLGIRLFSFSRIAIANVPRLALALCGGHSYCRGRRDALAQDDGAVRVRDRDGIGDGRGRSVVYLGLPTVRSPSRW